MKYITIDHKMIPDVKAIEAGIKIAKGEYLKATTYECEGCAAMCVLTKRLSEPDVCVLTGKPGLSCWKTTGDDSNE